MMEDRIIVGSDRKKKRPVLGKVIECHDCRELGYVAITKGLRFTLPSDWKMAWCGLKPLFICGDCSAERRKLILEKLLKNPKRERR